MPPLSQPRSRYGLPSLPALTNASTDLRQRVVADMRALAPVGFNPGAVTGAMLGGEQYDPRFPNNPLFNPQAERDRAILDAGRVGGGYSNYQDLQTIPGTATNWTLDNPGPNPPPLNPWLQGSKPWALARNPNQGTPPPTGVASPVVAQQAWFQPAFDPSLNKPELPWWMRR